MVKLIDQFSVTELFANSCKKKITDSRIAQITTKDNTKGKQEEYWSGGKRGVWKTWSAGVLRKKWKTRSYEL